MSLREVRHDSPSGRFSKLRGLSASVSFLSSPPLPALLLAPFFARSLALVPRSLLLNRTETLATQARYFCTILVNQRGSLRWLKTVLRAVSGNSRDGACFKLDKQT